MQQNLFAIFGVVASLAWIVLPSIAQEEEEKDAPPVRALIISGGGSHDFSGQVEILKAGIEERTKSRIAWTVYVDESGRSDLQIPALKSPLWAESFDIVIHHHCFTRVTDPGYIDQILKPHWEGLPALILHSALFSFPTDDGRWGEFCGMRAVSHLPETIVEVALAESGNAILDGLSGWSSTGEEQYQLERTASRVEVLAESSVAGNEARQPAIWAHEFGEAKTRVFATSLGNDEAGLREAGYLDAVSRGFLWALGKSQEAEYLKITAEESLSQLPIKEDGRSFLNPGRSLIAGGSAGAMSEDVANGSLARNAIDGECVTFWRSSGPGPSVWEVTLDEPVEISALALEWHEFQPKAYQIEGSLDLLKWSTLARGGLETMETGRSLYHFPATAVRAIRISFPVTRPGEHPGIREVAAYRDQNEIPAAFVHEAGLSDGLRASTHEGVSGSMRIHPEWTIHPSRHLLHSKVNPVELIECADRSSFLLADSEGGSRTVFRLFESGETKPFLPDLAAESSITWDGEWLYVLEDLQLTKVRDTSGDGTADERHRLGRILNPENGSVRVMEMHLAIDGWIYAVLESGVGVIGTDLVGRPVTLPRHGVVRFRRDASAFQLFVSSLEPVVGLRSVGQLSFAVVSEAGEGEPVSRFLQYGVFPGRPLASFPKLPPEYLQLESKGDFVYAIGQDREPSLLGQLKGLQAVFPREDGFFAVINEGAGALLLNFVKHESAAITNAGVSLDSLSDLELFPLLSSPFPETRKEGVFEILRRKRDWRTEAESLLQDRKSLSYLPSLALLSQMKGGKTFELLADAARLSHQPGAYRLLGDRKEAENHRVFSEITKVKDPDVTTEILAAIARSNSTIKGLDDLVLSFAAVDHEQLASTAVEWLIQRDSTAVCFSAIDEESDPGKRRAALAVLSRLPKATVAEGLVLRLEQTGGHEFRREGLAALCHLYFVNGEAWKSTPLIDSFLRASLTDRRVDTAWLLDHMLQNEIPISDLEELAMAADWQMPLRAATVALMLAQGTVPDAARSWLGSIVSETSHDPNLRAGALALVLSDLNFKTAFEKTSELLDESLIHSSKEALLLKWKSRPDLKEHEATMRRYLNIPARGQSLLARLTLKSIGVGDPAPLNLTGVALDGYEGGFEIFQRQNCHQCHNLHGEGSAIGPDLVSWIKNADDNAFEAAVRNPGAEIAKTVSNGAVRTEERDAVEGSRHIRRQKRD